MIQPTGMSTIAQSGVSLEENANREPVGFWMLPAQGIDISL
jgi:hypothetical protein